MKERTVISREELFKRVWETPMRTLAPQLGLSDVGLAKICKRHNIPRPPQGYWIKKEHGKQSVRPELPPLNDPKRATFEISAEQRDTYDEKLSDWAREALRFEQAPEARITVPDEVGKLHPLVAHARKALTQARSIRRDEALHSSGQCLDIRASKECLPRALRIANSFVLAVEARGWKVIVKDDSRGYGRRHVTAVQLTIGQCTEEMPFFLREAL